MSDTTLVLLCVAAVAVLLDLVVPSGGLLTGTALALIIERVLNWAGVAAIVRWPLAGLGMLVTVGLAIRFGERISERLFPARVRTNVDRLVGLEGQVHALRAGAPIVALEGDLWTARSLDDAPLAAGQTVRVVALVDQVPVVQAVEEEMGLVYQVPQATVMVFERMGRFHRLAQSGLRFRLPVLDAPKCLDEWTSAVRRHGDLPVLVELSEQQSDTQPRTIITRDNVEMLADATVFWQIVDPVRAVYEVDNLPRSIADLAVTTLRNLLGALTLNDALGARGRINEGLLAEIDATCRKWGVRVNRVEVQELRAANPEASGAMLQQMASERQREATVARAEGERRARLLRAEGTARGLETLVETDLATYRRAAEVMGEARAWRYLLALKYLDTVERIADSPSTKLFLPGGADLWPMLAGALGGALDEAPEKPEPGGGEGA